VVKALAACDVKVVVVDKKNLIVFNRYFIRLQQPSFSGGRCMADPVNPGAPKNAMVVLGEVTGGDTASKVVKMSDGHHFDYDYLVLATGATHSYFNHPEWPLSPRGSRLLKTRLTFGRGYCSALSRPIALTTRPSDRAIDLGCSGACPHLFPAWRAQQGGRGDKLAGGNTLPSSAAPA
jgi:NADH dehydrogenase